MHGQDGLIRGVYTIFGKESFFDFDHPVRHIMVENG
jgi:hypothetical protein